jgi:sugar lactone lactonase YvrE
VDREGNIFVSDTDAATVHKITPRAEIVLLPGGASIVDPVGLGVDRQGNVFVADLRHEEVFKVTPDGRTSPAATATLAEPRFRRPISVAIDRAGNAFIADSGDGTIRRIAADGTLSTFAGEHGSFGDADGSASSARFRSPHAIAVDRFGTLYVADDRSHSIRTISSGGFVSTLAGEPGQSGSVDGTGRDARFREPKGIAVDGFGNIYVADTGNSVIRRITVSGEVTTWAGKAGEPGGADGAVASARFRKPESIAADEAGNVFVADTGNRSIRQILSEGVVTTIAGHR